MGETGRTGSLLAVIQLSQSGTEEASARKHKSGELVCGKNDASDTVTEGWAEGQVKVHKQIFSGEDADEMGTVLAGAWRTDRRHWVTLHSLLVYAGP